MYISVFLYLYLFSTSQSFLAFPYASIRPSCYVERAIVSRWSTVHVQFQIHTCMSFEARSSPARAPADNGTSGCIHIAINKKPIISHFFIFKIPTRKDCYATGPFWGTTTPIPHTPQCCLFSHQYPGPNLVPSHAICSTVNCPHSPLVH